MFAAVLDAIVLLGCRILPGGKPSEAGRRRVEAAARAFHRGDAPLVVGSGGRRWHGVSEAEALARELTVLSVPSEVVVLELRSLSTGENARSVAELAAHYPLKRVGIVTCDWHMRRALASFAAAGLDAVAIAAPSPAKPRATRVRRAVRERVSTVLDRFATWGWAAR